MAIDAAIMNSMIRIDHFIMSVPWHVQRHFTEVVPRRMRCVRPNILTSNKQRMH